MVYNFFLFHYLLSIFIFDCTGQSTNHLLELTTVTTETAHTTRTTDTTESTVTTEPPVVDFCGNYTNDVSEGSWQSPNYPEPYFNETFDYSCSVAVEKGYYIELSIIDFNLNVMTDDYVLIKPGESINSNGKGIIFAKIVNRRKFIIQQNTLFMKFQSYNYTNGNNGTGFFIQWKRQGQPALGSTTEEPITEVTPAGPNISEEEKYYTVYIIGIMPDDFISMSIDKQFKELFATAAQKFCLDNQIELLEKITKSNVKIKYAVRCMPLWHNNEKCVKIFFAVPVSLVNTSTYELTSYNLAKIWNSLTDADFDGLDWTKYLIPDVNTVLNIWFTTIGVLILVFIIILLVIRYLAIKFTVIKDRHHSITNLPVAEVKKNSDVDYVPTQYVEDMDDNDLGIPDYSSNINDSLALGHIRYDNNTGYTNPNFSNDSSDDEILNVLKLNVQVNNTN